MPNWKDILTEITGLQAQCNAVSRASVDHVRQKYLTLLHQKTGRNIITYYSGWLTKSDVVCGISDEDKNGFMMAVHQLDRSKGLDLFLHTEGGGIHATQSIVHYLRQMFGHDIRAVVPQIAMSAGTMVACCCKSILM